MADLCLAEDVEFHPAPEWPGWRIYRGRDEVTAFLRDEVAEVIALSNVEIERETVAGDEVIFCLRAQVAGDQSGLHLDRVPIFHVALVQNGMVVRIRAFLDEAAARRAVGLD